MKLRFCFKYISIFLSMELSNTHTHALVWEKARFSTIEAIKIIQTLCGRVSGRVSSVSQWTLKLMEVFLTLPELLEGGEGDKKFIVFPAREMSADSLSWPPCCKTSPP